MVKFVINSIANQLLLAVIFSLAFEQVAVAQMVPPSPGVTIYLNGTSIGQIWDCQIIRYQMDAATMQMVAIDDPTTTPWRPMAPEYITMPYPNYPSNGVGAPTTYTYFSGRHTYNAGQPGLCRVFFRRLNADGTYSQNVPPVWFP